MKPIALYQGGAPNAMAMMGHGVAEGIGKVGQLYAQGIMSASKDIASQIEEYGKIKKSATALKSFVSNLKDDEGGVISSLKALMENPEVSDADRVKFGTDVVGKYAQTVFDLQKIQEANKGRLDLQSLKSGAAAGVALPPLPTVTPSPKRQSTTQSTEQADNKINFNTSKAGDVDLNVNPFNNPYPRIK